MSEVPQHIREFLVNHFNDENNGLINRETINEIDNRYNLNLNINYEDPDEVPSRMFRYNCLDKIIFMELLNDPNLPFNRIIEIINERIEMINNNPFEPIIKG
jgi:hypothetical protein